MSKNISYLSSLTGLKDNLFEAQQKVSSDSEEVVVQDKAKRALAEKSLMGVATLESSSSFYDFMQGENANKKAYFCNGTACLCASGNIDKNVKQKLQQYFGEKEVGHVTCLGHCYDGAAFQIDGNNYSGSDIDNLSELSDAKKATTIIPKGKSLGKAILLEPVIDVKAWYQPLLEALKNNQAEQLLETLKSASLRGRGGAGFPAGIKWQACRDQVADKKYIVCNADEGDPGAFTDRYLLEQQPHLVLFGMMVAGYLAGSDEGILYIRDEYPLAIDITQQAIDELIELQLLGSAIDGSDFSFNFQIIRGAGAYICGEETALIRSIEGQRPVVSVRPPFPVVSGLFGKPTVLNNVETFACTHWILAQGGDAFCQMGTEQSAGVKLVSLDVSFNNPGVYEVAMGTSLTRVIDELGGGFSYPVKALQIGGPLGGIVPKEKFDQLNISFESFAEQGFLLGHAGIVGIPEEFSMLEYIAHLFEFTATESCGKCFPCRLGATRGQEMVEAAMKGTKMDKQLLNDLLETMELGSLCALGGGVPLPVKNALEWFEDELKTAFVDTAIGDIL
ncbi:MAG: formate dehydrogenase [Gammaproteobacteria bacterium]|nr:MAG: formate dehydrogenase [Gammaproteobacteria bacterium]